VLAAAYHARLDLTGLPPAAAAAARSSVCGGLAEAGRLRSASLGHSVRAAFVHGIDISLLVPAGIAAVGVILTLAFLPRSAALELSAPPRREAARAGEH
jgi:DHA2 family multidrug resistance protein-like MFS transporter